MDEHIELEKAEYKAKRFKELGFYPQKEIRANKLLPMYADQLDKESNEMLNSIKNNLARTVAVRDIKPGVMIVLTNLINYIELYGLKFSKEDHIKFIKLLLALIEMTMTEPSDLDIVHIALSILLTKTYLLSPDDIEIDWKPLYKLSQLFLVVPNSKCALYRHQLTLTRSLGPIILLCNPYFSKTATQEILDEIFPKLSPLDYEHPYDAMKLLGTFLNKTNYELWFLDFMQLWNVYHDPSWSIRLMEIMASVAVENIGLINWEPFIPTIFTRILRSINLPDCFNNKDSFGAPSFCTRPVSLWITATLGPKSSTQKYLTIFLGAIESYLHPANSGKWLHFIFGILADLPKSFFDRLIRERYRKHPWKRPIADEHKLTENCISEFVESLKPIAFQAIYSHICPIEMAKLFNYLAELRPEVIIPDVIDRVYATLDSLTEPHKMTAALNCLIGVSTVLVSGHNGYTDGKTHVIPILFLTLPGIDPNDLYKTVTTFKFLHTFLRLVLITDCSKAYQYYDDLSEEEIMICDQTAEFESFVLQYIDKVFVLIESFAQHMEVNSASSNSENPELDVKLMECTCTILNQSSMEIQMAANRKMVRYLKTHFLEPWICDSLLGSFVRSFRLIHDTDVHNHLLPYLITAINSFINDHEDIFEIDKQSDELLYYIILLTSMARGDPMETIQFVDEIVPIIDKISKFKCKLTNRYSNAIVMNILSNLSTLQTIDVHSCPESFDKPLSEFLPVRHWGYMSELPIKWYIPDERARNCCEMLIHRYLLPILEQFDKYCNDEISVTRDEVLRDTSTVLTLLKCTNFLPNWTDEPLINISGSIGEQERMNIKIGFEDKAINMPDGSNVRKRIIQTFTKLQEKILKESEDDIQSLKAITLLWERVHMRREFDIEFLYALNNKLLESRFVKFKLTKIRRELRQMTAYRTLRQLFYRDLIASPAFTNTHKIVLFNLLKLSTSRYYEVRRQAQMNLNQTFTIYERSNICLIDEITNYLALDSNKNHETFKGALYILGESKYGRLIARNDLESVRKIWLALLKTNLSEKPSVVRLLDVIVEAIKNEFPTLAIVLNISDSCVTEALNLATDKSIVSEEEIRLGKQRLEENNARNLQTYNDILASILEITHNNSLHWRYGLIASNMISNLVHPFVNYPPDIIRYSLHNLIHESIEERKIAIEIVGYVMKQQKQKHIKIQIDPFQIAGVPKPSTKLKPGIRDDNRWLLYDINTVPKNQIEWDEPKFSHKSEGFFGWSTSFSVYAPTSQQPNIDRTRNEMTVAEQVIFDFFSNDYNFDKLIKFWSLEEEEDMLDQHRIFMIRALVSTYGETFTDVLCGHIKRLIEIRDAESNHRCAAELMAGLMKGLKHWSFDKTKKLYEKLQPLIRLALSNITVETDDIWVECFGIATLHFDPKRQYWLYEVLLEEPIRGMTSFNDISRLSCLQASFDEGHIWRMPSVSHRLYEYLRPYLSHPFQSFRSTFAIILINICEADLPFIDCPKPECVRIKRVIKYVLKRNKIFREELLQLDSDEAATSAAETARLVDTAYRWLYGFIMRKRSWNVADFFRLIALYSQPLRVENVFFHLLTQPLTLPPSMNVVLLNISHASLHDSRSIRSAITDFLQAFVFNNMFILLSRKKWVAQIQLFVLRLLEDSALEVRTKTAKVLSGLLHCSFLPETDKLVELFKRNCQSLGHTSRRLPSNSSVDASISTNLMSIETQLAASSVLKRHAGILGLCAFISAYPYDIPDFVLDIFDYLFAHLNDPQPIPSTIRETVSDFKRSHQDNWATHQLKFSENQLTVLNDLTVPPSSYCYYA